MREDLSQPAASFSTSISLDKVSTMDDNIIQWDSHKDDKRQDFCHSGAHKQVDNMESDDYYNGNVQKLVWKHTGFLLWLDDWTKKLVSLSHCVAFLSPLNQVEPELLY